ncbi:hypothetical protein ABVT39_004458 [Epinephelus coioides]
MDQSQIKILFDAIKQSKDDMISYFDSKADPISITLKEMKISLSTLGDHVARMEQMRTINNLLIRVKELENDKSYFMDKVEDLENRSRSLNLRLIRESAEGHNMLDFMTRVIPHILG